MASGKGGGSKNLREITDPGRGPDVVERTEDAAGRGEQVGPHVSLGLGKGSNPRHLLLI